jgi:hypothetical protein
MLINYLRYVLVKGLFRTRHQVEEAYMASQQSSPSVPEIVVRYCNLLTKSLVPLHKKPSILPESKRMATSITCRSTVPWIIDRMDVFSTNRSSLSNHRLAIIRCVPAGTHQIFERVSTMNDLIMCFILREHPTDPRGISRSEPLWKHL